jgi:arylsulfatase
MPDNDEKSGPTPAAETPDVLPRPDFHFDGQIGRTYLDSDPARFTQPQGTGSGNLLNPP